MKRFVLAAAAVVMMCATPQAALAQGGHLLLTPFAGATFGGDLNATRGTFGGALTFMGDKFGLELDFANTPDFFGDDDIPGIESNATTFMASLKWMHRVEDRGVQPYLVAGVGLVRTRLDADDIFDNLTTNDFGFNLGGGLGVFFADHVGLRADVRYIRAFQDADLGDDIDFEISSFDFWRATIGLAFKF
jgi:opacity protein-like surface antigen